MRANVRFRCACARDELVDAAGAALPVGDEPELCTSASLRYYPIEELYFCTTCAGLRCNDCIAWEAACYYCPGCLFEVPNTNVAAQHGVCMRSCFTCPLCSSLLTVHGSDVRGVALTSAEANMPVPPFYLACPACRWDSMRIGIAFEMPTPSVAHDDLLRAEFAQLQRYWAPTVLRNIGYVEKPAMVNPMTPLRRSWLARDVPGLSARYLGLRSAIMPPTLPDDDGVYVPHNHRSQSKQASRDERKWHVLSQRRVLDGAGAVTTLQQRFAAPDQPYDTDSLRPRRMRLQAKFTKRCPDCRHMLVRPEPRASSSRFKMRLLAKNHVPIITAATETAGGLVVALYVTNPRNTEMDVKIWLAREPVASFRLSAADEDIVPVEKPGALLNHGAQHNHGRGQVAFRVDRTGSHPLRVEYAAGTDHGTIDAALEVAD